MARFSRKKKLVVALVVVLVLVFVVLPAYIAYSSLHPARCGSMETPGDYGLSYVDVEVMTEDGVLLKGWVIEPAGGVEKEAVLVLMHGYTSCKADPDLLAVASAFAKMGYWVVMFDFRGHGESNGTTTIGPKEARYDAPAILGLVEERFPGRPVALLGYSMGGVVAIMAGNGDPRVTAIISDSPYPVLSEVVPRWLKAKMGIPTWYSSLIGFWGSLFSGEDLDFGPMKLESIDKPLLVIVGTEDPLVTPEEAKQIAEKSPRGETLVVEGAGHVEAARTLGIDAYTKIVDDFIARSLAMLGSGSCHVPGAEPGLTDLVST